MEDRYLFKAKHFKEWHIGNIVKEPDGLYIRDIKKNVMAFINNESTICQCTGLKDKNGKLIWENDIVRDIYGNFYAVFYQNNYYRFSWICVKSDVFLIGAKWHLWDINSLEVEVIGNIFDNSDLLGINTQNDLNKHWLEKYTEENAHIRRSKF